MTSTRAWTLLGLLILAFVAGTEVVSTAIVNHAATESCDVCGQPASRHFIGVTGQCHYCAAHSHLHGP